VISVWSAEDAGRVINLGRSTVVVGDRGGAVFGKDCGRRHRYCTKCNFARPVVSLDLENAETVSRCFAPDAKS